MILEDIKNINNNLNYDTLSNEDIFQDFLNFLKKPYEQMPLIIYCKNIWLNSLIVPKENLTGDYNKKLLNWNIHQSSYSYSTNNNKEYALCEPCESYNPQEILKDATPIFLERAIFNHTDDSIELNQKISHRLDIVELDKNHFYKLNERGDKEEVASINNNDIKLCQLNYEELNKYLCISNSLLIRFFNVDVFKEISFKNRNKSSHTLSNIRYNEDICYDDDNNVISKEIRGFQIFNSVHIKNKEKNYEEFLAWDLETNNLVNHTCNPKELKNYFVKSDNIYETSPVFFNTEVLNKYQNDSEKYEIQNRHIYCKGIWSLRYSMSENKKQVIVYIGDLSHLPEYEQKYWKAFNEEPKSKISEHIIKTDFLGEWDDVIDPLISLKECLSKFPPFYIKDVEYKLWDEKNKDNIRSLSNLQYIKHETKENWEKGIRNLHQIIIEGFNEKNINKLAKELDCFDKDLRSLKQLKECITILYDSQKAKNIIKPLIELNTQRINTEHNQNNSKYPSDLIKDYNFRIRNCYISMQWLYEQIEKGKFNI